MRKRIRINQPGGITAARDYNDLQITAQHATASHDSIINRRWRRSDM